MRSIRLSLLVPVALLIAVGAIAFKGSDSERIDPQWYLISVNDSNPQNDEIGGETSDPGQDETCDQEFLGPRCAIQLTLPSPAYDPEGKTVAQAVSDGAIIEDETFQEE